MTAALSRRCVAELLGTFAIVFFGCGSIVTLQQQDAHLMVNLVFGLVVAASIYALGHVSGAYFNPAVTVGIAATKHFPWKEVPAYLIAQISGAIAASALHFALFADKAKTAHYGATIPTASPGVAVVTEAIITFFLMLVITSVATDKRANPAIPGLAIGMAVAICGLFAGPITGCSMNPARSLAPALFAGGEPFAKVWIFFVGPTVGALLATITYQWLAKPDTANQAAFD